MRVEYKRYMHGANGNDYITCPLSTTEVYLNGKTLANPRVLLSNNGVATDGENKERSLSVLM